MFRYSVLNHFRFQSSMSNMQEEVLVSPIPLSWLYLRHVVNWIRWLNTVFQKMAPYYF